MLIDMSADPEFGSSVLYGAVSGYDFVVSDAVPSESEV